MSIALTTVVKQAEDQLSCNLGDEIALLNLKSTLYFGLDGVGAFIWQVIEKPRPVVEICRAVIERYQVDEARCRADLLGFLNKLNDLGLIEMMPSPAPLLGSNSPNVTNSNE
jgi:Coenzyme PQQ synthesis protein D (PqqD)